MAIAIKPPGLTKNDGALHEIEDTLADDDLLEENSFLYGTDKENSTSTQDLTAIRSRRPSPKAHSSSKRIKTNNGRAVPKKPSPRDGTKKMAKKTHVPEPRRNDFPTTTMYKSAMVWHWRITLNESFHKIAIRFNAKFPPEDGKGVSSEAVRRRYHRMKKSGAGGESVAQDATDSGGENDDDDDDDDDDESSETAAHPSPSNSLSAKQARPRATYKLSNDRKEPKRKIVQWRDEDKMGFDQIRDKLESDFQWSLGQPTVQKYYYQTRARMEAEAEAGAGSETAQGTSGQSHTGILQTAGAIPTTAALIAQGEGRKVERRLSI